MRKALKLKRRSCAMCKPFKMGGANRWKSREFARLRESESDIRKALRRAR